MTISLFTLPGYALGQNASVSAGPAEPAENGPASTGLTLGQNATLATDLTAESGVAPVQNATVSAESGVAPTQNATLTIESGVVPAQNASVPASTDFPEASQAGTPQLTRLTNGLSVLIIPDNRFPLVSTRLYVHAGSAYETPAQAGISHLLEHMVFKGTPTRPQGTIAKEIEDLGGYTNAATSFDYTVYIVDVPAAHWAKGLDILQDMAFNPLIDANELESEKKVVLSELERGEDDSNGYIFNQIQAMALAGTPYERPIIGYRETVSAFTRQDILDYIANWYQPQSMLLVVCGQVNPQAVLEEANKLFGERKNTHLWSPPQSIDPKTLAKGPNIKVEKRPLNQVYLHATLPVPGYTAPNEPALEILTHLLGGDNTSLFYRKYKYETQLVDDISVYLYSFERLGMIYIGALLDADKLVPFWQQLSKDLPKLSSANFSEAELARAKLNIEDSMFRSQETISGLTSKMGTLYFQTGNLNAEEEYLHALHAVSLKDVQAEMEQWLKPEAFNAMALTPENLDAPDLSGILNTSWPSAAQTANVNATELAEIEKEVIDLGDNRTLILLPDNTLPYLSVSLNFAGGDLLLLENEQGLNDLTAATLTKGTKQKKAPQLEVFLAERAANLSASASKETFALGGSWPVQFNKDMLGLIKETLSSPAFAKQEVEREKSSQIAEISSKEDQPLGLAFRKLMPFLFPNQTQGFYRMGEPENVAKFTSKQVQNYWKKQIAQPWVLAVCGQFDRDEMIAFAQSLPKPSSPKQKMPEPVWTKENNLSLHMPGRNQSHILMVFETSSALSEDNPKLDLLATMLSGQGGLLFTELRDKQGLGYSVTAVKWQSGQTGLLAFYIGTEPGKTEQAMNGFNQIITNLQTTPLAPELLSGAVNQMQGDYYRSHQRLSSRSSEAAGLAILDYPLDYSTATIEAAKNVTPEEIQALAQKYFVPAKAYIVRVDP